MTEQINTVDEVIERLGGRGEVARLTGVTTQAVTNWRTREPYTMPPETFLVLTKALNEKNLYAPPSLWRMREPVSVAAS